MKKELQDTIVAACPLLYRNTRPRFGDGWFECGDGWYDLIFEISKILEAEAARVTPRAVKFHIVKEKFGMLRYGFIGEVSDEVDRQVTALELKSTVTCEQCGAPGIRAVRNGWHCTLCESCERDHS